jgi:hypothetical protein
MEIPAETEIPDKDNSAMTPQLQQACRSIASEIGPDVGEFTPADEKHLLGEVAFFALAGSFLSGFFGGFAKAAGEKSGEKLGSALIGFVSKKLHGERALSPDEQSKSLDAAASAAKKAALTPEMTAAIAVQVEKALAAALAEQAEPDIADRVAARVREEAVRILTTPQVA